MIKGIGIDIIELERIERAVNKNDRFIDRILTKKERAYVYELTNNRRKIEYIAGRFAAKEAFAKAAGTGIGNLRFQHIEVIHDEKGAPKLRVLGYEQNTLYVSISHSKEYAVAQVIITI